eukprot:UN2959
MHKLATVAQERSPKNETPVHTIQLKEPEPSNQATPKGDTNALQLYKLLTVGESGRARCRCCHWMPPQPCCIPRHV